MGLRTQSIKTGKKLSIFSKELMFVVAETTFVFEKEEKEEEVLQKKTMKSTTKSGSRTEESSTLASTLVHIQC